MVVNKCMLLTTIMAILEHSCHLQKSSQVHIGGPPSAFPNHGSFYIVSPLPEISHKLSYV